MKKLLVFSMLLMSFVSCSKESGSPTTQSPNVKKTSSVQCSGTTQAGSRCKNMTLSANGKCYLHGGN